MVFSDFRASVHFVRLPPSVTVRIVVADVFAARYKKSTHAFL